MLSRRLRRAAGVCGALVILAGVPAAALAVKPVGDDPLRLAFGQPTAVENYEVADEL